MNSELLADALGRAELPDSSGALERTVAAARQTVAAPAMPADRRPVARRALVFAVVALLVAAFVSLTPPGRAAAEWVSELFAFGEANQAVVDLGSSPDGTDYEIRVQNSEGGGRESCLMFAWEPPPQEGPRGFGACGSGLMPRDPIEIPFIQGAPDGGLIVAAITELDVSEARLEYRVAPRGPEVEVPARVHPIAADAVVEVGGRVPTLNATMIVAFTPPGIGKIGGPTSAELVVVDEEGKRYAETVAWTEGIVPDTKTPCGLGRGPHRDECRAVIDPEFRHRELIRSLIAPQPPQDYIARAAKAGVTITPLSDAELGDLWETVGEPVELTEAVAAARAPASKTLGTKAGSYTAFLVRDATGRLVYAVRFKPGVGENLRRPRQEALVLVDALTGEALTAAELPSR